MTAGMPEKNDDKQTRDVKGGQERGDDREHEDRHVVYVGERKNGVFAKESTERRTAHERECADQKCNKCDGEIFGQAAHLPNVLFVMERDDDGTGSEEEQRLEE